MLCSLTLLSSSTGASLPWPLIVWGMAELRFIMAARFLAGLRGQLPYRSPPPSSHQALFSVLLRAWYSPVGQAVRQRHSWKETTDRAPPRSTGRRTDASGQGRGHTARRPAARAGGLSARVGQVMHAGRLVEAPHVMHAGLAVVAVELMNRPCM
jgi:hypothetical protein